MHTFLEKGHILNEGDSINATIKCAKKNKACLCSGTVGNSY